MSELEKGAFQAVNSCLKIGADDKVVVVTDVHTMDNAVAVMNEAKKKTNITWSPQVWLI